MHQYLKIILFFALFLSSHKDALAQHEADNWILSDSVHLKFQGDSVIVINPNFTFGTGEPNSSISDSFGNLIMFADEDSIYDKNYKPILNVRWNNNWRWSSSQGALILKHPLNSIYHLFTTETRNVTNYMPLHYNSIDISKTNLKFIEKERSLLPRVSEKLNSINHQNNKDIWIATHSFFRDTFYFHLLKKDGLVCCPIKQNYGLDYNDWPISQGEIQFSKNGSLAGVTSHAEVNTQLFKFNNEYAKLSHSINLNNRIAVGIEFSPNNKFVYINNVVSIDKKLVQYNLSNWDQTIINNSKYIVFDTLPPHNLGRFWMNLQVTKNNQIFCMANLDSFIYTIQKPNLKGKACALRTKYIPLKTSTYKSFPNFNQSYFYQPSIDFAYEHLCTNNTLQFWGEDTIGGTTHKWSIKKGTKLEASFTSKNITFTFKDTGKYSVEYIASNGTRADTVIKIVTLHPKIEPSFLGKDTFYCKGTKANIALTVPQKMHCVHWYKDSTTREISRNDTLVIDTAGTYYVKITNKSFCVYWDTIIISEINPPQLALSLSSKDICFDKTIKIQAHAQSGFSNKYSYNWNYNGIDTTTSDSVLSIQHDSALQIFCSLGDGCSPTITDSLWFYPQIIADYSLDKDSSCNPLIFKAEHPTFPKGTQVQWFFDNLLYKKDQTIFDTLKIKGSYILKLLTQNKGCIDSTEKTLKVYQPSPLSIQLQNLYKNSNCFKDTLRILAQNTGGIRKDYEWKWTINEKKILLNDSILKHPADSITKIHSVLSDRCNIQEVKDSIIIYPQPRLDVSLNPENGCSPLEVSGNNKAKQIKGELFERWNLDTLKIIKQNSFIQSLINPKNYKIKYVVWNKYCSDSFEKTVTVYPLPLAQFTFNPIHPIIEDTSIQFQNLSKGASSYQWNFGDLNTSILINPKHDYSESGDYSVRLIATSDKNCRDTITQSFTVFDQGIWFLPNALKIPEEDGVNFGNDEFKPIGTGIKSFHIYVTSRWGKIMHNTTNIPWKPKSGILQGNYYYHVKVEFLNGKKDEKKGSLMVLR